ncbi:hypothetical protein [Bythopirellula polymerisocia]|uniref:Ferritin-like domain protein n=1 Tax=Bythopirellula polymerisocia TaxID=2528003 RepID=A0A5C6CLU5_9BACT|nr:hypothetical protein [Bythopirellula polymerisocia]TWU25873.1 hypothetical protein Pla144_30860 [Bythopirellula polymerisocia]
MFQASLYHLLNQLLGIVGKSFPQYIRYSRPYMPPGSEAIVDTIEAIVHDQDVLAERIGVLLVDAEAPLRPGGFPMEYTDTHDLSIDYQLAAAIGYQQQDIDSIRALIDELQSYPEAKALCEEALGMAKGHLESLQEVLPASSSAS